MREQNALVSSLAENVQHLRELLQGCDDFVFRPFVTATNTQGMLVFTPLSIDSDLISQTILPSLYRLELPPQKALWLKALKIALPFLPEKSFSQWEDILMELMDGNTLVLLDGVNEGFMAATKKNAGRSIEKPLIEAVIRGPQEAFAEALNLNLAVMRCRIKNSKLKINRLTLGEDSKSNIALIYLEDTIQPELLTEIRNRLTSIKLPSAQESGFLIEFLTRNTYTPFPLIQSTERPDKVVAALLEGRATILVDGSPFALLLPSVFWHFFQSSDDYFQHFLLGSVIRILRYVAYFFAICLPGLYIAFTVFQPEMLPLRFLFTLSTARENVPFTTWVEAMTMLVILDIFREAVLRLPSTIGPAIGIVGALVMGEAAVSAGVISPLMVIILSFTAVATFAVPNEDIRGTARMFSYLILFLSASLGLYGLILGISAILLHLCSLESIGVPYTSPIATMHTKEWSDVLGRAPWHVLNRKPQRIKIQFGTSGRRSKS